ncbi:hypothetical protein Trydic_g16350 [Trypoxylus dichotomus]
MHDSEAVKKMGIQDTNKIPKTVDVLGISSKNNDVTSVSQSIINPNATDRYVNTAVVSKKPDDLPVSRKLLKNGCKIIPNNKKLQGNFKPITATKEPARQSISTLYRERMKYGKRRSKSAENFNPSKCIEKNIHDKLQTSCSLSELSNYFQPEEHTKNLLQNKNRPIQYSRKSLAFVKSPVKKSFTLTNNYQKLQSSSVESLPQNCAKNDVSKGLAGAVAVGNSMQQLQEESELDISVTPIKKKELLFKTPFAYNRRSIVQLTPSTDRKSIYKLHSSTPAPSDLQKRLNEWLVKHGKSLSSFHHLKCFGLHNTTNEHKETYEKDEENKENLQNVEDENRKSIKLEETHHTANIDYETVAKDALDDLHKLIQDGYPVDQCDAWLGRIRHKYRKLEEQPLYWECRAALEQCKGNISSAVEHYRKAIVNGAEIRTIEGSLDQLLQKFSLLNINPDVTQENTKTSRLILDAQNAFKSTIIQFAVQERMLKKKEDAERKLIVTPVRRSTRLSVKHSGSSYIKLCSSIKDIEMDENTEFQKNSYLSIRFSP